MLILAILLALILAIIAAIATISLFGKSDENYRGAAKKNSINLTIIYTIAIVLSLVAVGIYIVWFV